MGFASGWDVRKCRHLGLFLILVIFTDKSVSNLDSHVPINEYYLAAVEIEWDYAPSGRGLVYDDQRCV